MPFPCCFSCNRITAINDGAFVPFPALHHQIERLSMTLFLQLSMVLLSVQAADIQFSLDPSQVEFTDFMGEEVVYIPGGASPFGNGDPALPGMGYSMVIPQGTTLEDVQVQVLSTVELPGTHRISPVLSIPLNEQIPAVIPHSDSYIVPIQKQPFQTVS